MAQKKKTKKTKDVKGKKPSLAMVFFGTAATLALTTFLAFVSPELSIMALIFLVFSAYLHYENDRRVFWQKKTENKIKGFSDQQDKLTKELARYRQDLDTVKHEVKALSTPAAAPKPKTEPDTPPAKHKKTDEMIRKRMKFSTRPVPPKKKAANTDVDLSTPAPSPSRIKKDPPLTGTPSSTPANHDPHADYDALSDMVVKELVHHAVKSSQVDLFVQPIMRLPQRQARFYEIFARIRAKPGMYLPASRYMELAREDKQMNKIDYLLLMQCLKTIKDSAHIDKATPFFINITTGTLSNGQFMKELLGFLSKNRDLAPRLIFEIKQYDFENMQPAVLEILRGLGRLGCALSIDHVTNLEFDIKFLQVLKVRFIKIDAKALAKNTTNDKAFSEINRIKKKLEGNGIGFIVEKVESEEILKKILDFDINYGQGYLFGRPDFQSTYKQAQ